MRQTIRFRRTPMALALLGLSLPVAAMESLDEAALSEVSGQQGIDITVAAPSLTATSVAAVDDGNTLALNNVALTPIGAAQYQAKMTLDAGSSGGSPWLALGLTLQPAQFSTDAVTVTGTSGQLFDAALQLNQAATLNYTSGNGILSSTSPATLSVNATSFRQFIGQTYSGRRNLLLLDNGTLNASYTGLITLDSGNGLWFNGGTLNLNPLAFDVAWVGDQTSGYSATGASAMQHVGVKGDIDNFDLKVTGGGNGSITGNASGLSITASGNLNTNTLKTYLGPGNATGAYNVEFSRFVPFSNYNGTDPLVSLGTVTLDVIKSGDALPDLSSGYGKLTAGTPSLGVTARDVNFQAYPTQIDFYRLDTDTAGAIQNWSLISTLYNTSANLILAPGGHWDSSITTKRGIGFDLALATTASNAASGSSGDAGTHFLIADTTAQTYMGLRNIDLRLMMNRGQLFILDSSLDGDMGLRMTAKDISFYLNSEFAIGNLPDGTAANNIPNVAAGSTSPAPDQIFGLTMNMGLLSTGQLSFSLKPGAVGQSYLGYDAAITGLDPAKTSVTVTEPVDATQVQFANIAGDITVSGGKIPVSSNSVAFSQTTTLGSASSPFTIGSLNFINNSGGTSNSYRLGQMVFTGSQMYTSLTVSPQ